MRVLCRSLVLAIIIAFCIPGSVEAQFLSVTYEDRVQDHSGNIDLVALTLTFREATGEYEVVLEANEEASFQGDFLVGINLFNGDRGTTALDPSYFHAEAEVLDYDCPSLRYRLSGVDPRLRSWVLGDRIAAGGPEPLGLPSGFSFFNSGLASANDTIQADDLVGDGVVGILERASEFAVYALPPTAFDDSFEVLEDAPAQALDVLRNDCSLRLSFGALEITRVEKDSVRGQVDLLEGNLYYTPPKEFFGLELLNYVVSDAEGNSDIGTVNITVLSVNDPPIAKDDLIEINPRRSRHVLDVLENDSTAPDFDEALSLVEVDFDPSLGDVSIESDHLVLETVEPFRGEATITYTISDGNGGLAEAIVRIRMDQRNLDPTAVDDLVLGLEDKVLVIDVLANDTSAPDEGESLFIKSVGESHAQAELGVRFGKIHYAPPLDFFGSDLFTYQIGDGFGGSSQASVQVTIENTNDPPLAVNDLFEIVSDGDPYFLNPLLNDRSTPDPLEKLVLSELRYDGESANLSIEGDAVRVLPISGFIGSFEFEYVVRDENGGEAVGLASVRVIHSNFPPVANSDTVKIDDDGLEAVIDVLANDTSEPDRGETLTILSVIDTGVPGSQLKHNGRLVFLSPKEGFESGWFRYFISDGNGGQDSAVVVVTASPIIESPVAMDDFVLVLEDEDSKMNVLQNDFIGPGFKGEAVFSIVNGPSNGRAAFNNQGVIEYRPKKDFYGRDLIHYLIAYPTGTTSIAELLIEVENTNDPPVAVDDEFEMLEDGGAIRLEVLANDSSLPDLDDTLSLVAANASENGGIVGKDGNWVAYQPAQDFTGQDSFPYSIRDESGQLAFGRVSVTVLPVNDPPQVVPDSVEVDAGAEKVLIEVLANDSSFPDVDEALRVFLVTQGEFGGEVIIEDGHVFYSPPEESVSLDQFEYTVGDGNGGVSSASVTVNIRPADKMPEGKADEFVVKEDAESVRLDVLSNDQSGRVNGSRMLIASHGEVSGGGKLELESNTLYYTPLPDFYGSTHFSYRIAEGDFESEPVLVVVNVVSVNDPPIVEKDRFTLEDPKGSVLIDVLANDSSGVDFEETLTVYFVSLASGGGQVELVEGKVFYQPISGFSGVEEFSYAVSDGNGGIGTATVTVHVNRSDQVAPVMVCRDIEVMLPVSGELILDPRLIDGGSFDESGELELVAVPSRLGVEDIGFREVVLKGTDGSGNSSTCVAHVKILEPPRSQVELLYPKHRAVFRVSEDYLFNAVDVAVEVGLEGDFELIEIIGDGVTLISQAVAAGQRTVKWQWDEARWGDHEIEVLGHKTDGGFVKSVRSRFSVSELASHVAMAVPAELDQPEELELIAEYLFEMGVNLEVFVEPLPLDFADQKWDAVIWNGQGSRVASKESVAAFGTLLKRRISLYLMGEGLLGVQDLGLDYRRSWEEMTLMTQAETEAMGGLVQFFKEGDERLLKGRFGSVGRFTLDRYAGGRLIHPDANALIQIDGVALAASLDQERDGSGEGARRFVQLFSLAKSEAENQTKTLFQNAVCWLLPDCFDCVNADLPPVIERKVNDVFLGELFSVELSLVNNGACEVSGAELGVSSAGIDVSHLLIDGQPIPVSLDAENNRWWGTIGRVGKGSESGLSATWFLRVIDPATSQLEFETLSNNTAPAIVEMPIQITRVSIEPRAADRLALIIEGVLGQRFDVEFSNDLMQPIQWRKLKQSILLNDEGRASVELEGVQSARFFRVRQN